MRLLYAESCEPCVRRHIGPALDKFLDAPTTVAYCGGCGQIVEKHRVSYWYPWPTDD